MGYFRKALGGLLWMGGLRASTRLIAFAKIAILARLLAPNDFGLFGIAGLTLAFLEIFTETGINVFLIQEKKEITSYIDTAWLVSIVRGFLMTAAFLVAAPFIAAFFKSPHAEPLLYLMAVVPFLRGFINPAIVKFQKELRFNKEFYLRFATYFVDGAVAILAAFLTKSAISLIIGMAAGTALEVILSFVLIKPRPKLAFETDKFKKVIGRGKWVTASVIFNYLFQEGDDIVVGRLLATTQLGFYQMAYKVATLPITEVADTVAKVTFPVYVKMAEDTKRLKDAFLKTFLGVGAVVIPFGIVVFVFTQPIVQILLGPKWLEIVPVLKLLAGFGVLRALTAACYPVFLSVNKQEYVTATTFVGILGLAATIIPMVKAYGIYGAGISAIIGAALALPVAAVNLVRVFRKVL